MKIFEKVREEDGTRNIYFMGVKVFSYTRPKKNAFCSSSFWEMRYEQGGNSGAGSYGRLAQFKADVLNDFIEKNSITSLIEFGVGDGNQLALLRNDVSYIGFDVSQTVISQVTKKFQNDKSKRFFDLKLFHNQKAELGLSLDVVYHLIEENVFHNYMNNLFNASSKFVIIYSSNKDEEYVRHVKHRKFTDWIATNKKQWALIEYIPNKYPFKKEQPDDTSFADFYIYQKGTL